MIACSCSGVNSNLPRSVAYPSIRSTVACHSAGDFLLADTRSMEWQIVHKSSASCLPSGSSAGAGVKVGMLWAGVSCKIAGACVASGGNVIVAVLSGSGMDGVSGVAAGVTAQAESPIVKNTNRVTRKPERILFVGGSQVTDHGRFLSVGNL